MIRINLHRNARYPGSGKMPRWFQQLMNDAMNAYAEEWQVSAHEVWTKVREPDALEQLVEIVREHGVVSCVAYRHALIDSYGLRLAEDDPLVVEYKLKTTETETT